MQNFIKNIFVYFRIKINTFFSIFKSKKKKDEVLFCEETQRVINKKISKQLENNIVRFKLEKNRNKSGSVTFKTNKTS